MDAKGRPIAVENLKIGDKILGADGQPVNITDVTSRVAPLYRISMSFTGKDLQDDDDDVVEHKSDLVVTADHPLLFRRIPPPHALLPSETEAEVRARIATVLGGLPPLSPTKRRSNQSIVLPKYSRRRNGNGPERDTKHVPSNYKFTSRDVRRELLAGFVDGDGHYGYNVNIFEIVQSTLWHQPVIDDALFIICSLGYPVTVSYKDPDGHVTADGKPDRRRNASVRIVFSPEINEFPCRIERKQARGRTRAPPTTFKVERVSAAGSGTVHGFVVDGDHRVLRSDFLVVRDSSDPSSPPPVVPTSA